MKPMFRSMLPSLLAVCVVALVPALRAQVEQGPAQPQVPSNDVEVRGHGHCTPVRPATWCTSR